MTQQNGPRELPGVGCFSDLLANYRPLQIRPRTHNQLYPINHHPNGSTVSRRASNPVSSHFVHSDAECSRCPPGLGRATVPSPPGLDRLSFGAPPGLPRPPVPIRPAMTEEDLVPVPRQLKWSNADHNDFERLNAGLFTGNPSQTSSAHLSPNSVDGNGSGMPNQYRDNNYDVALNDFAMKVLLAQMYGMQQQQEHNREYPHPHPESQSVRALTPLDVTHRPFTTGPLSTRSYDSHQFREDPQYPYGEVDGRSPGTGFGANEWNADWSNRDRTRYEFARRHHP